jgi:GNAT superfamily N-acetyltransferase
MLTDFSETALTDAIHSNFHGLLHLMCEHTRGFEWVEREGATCMACDIPTSIYNRVIETRLEDAAVEEGIMEIIDFYSSRGLPFLWMVSPKDSPPDLPHRLEESGFVRSRSPGMAIDLRLLREPAAPPGFRIEPVQDEESLTDYSQLMPKAFGFDDYSRKAVSRWIQGVGLHEDISHYIGYLDDEPVASSSVFCADGVAGLYCVATTPEARGKGLGSLTSVVPLLAAREEGYNVGVLHSTMMAHGVYLRLGFKDYCDVVNYSRSESGDSYLQTLSRQR